MFKKNQFLFLSIFVHVILIYIVARSVMFPSSPSQEAITAKPIQASLIFEIQPPKAEEPAPIEAPVPELEPEITPEIAEVKETEVEEKPEPAVESEAPEAEEVVVTAEPIQREQQATVEQQQTHTEAPPAMQQAPPLPTEKVVTNMARRHLSNIRQQQQNRMAEQASRHFQQQKNAPIIEAEEKDKFLTEDEKFRESLKVRADCSSTSKKTAATVLGFLGGNIDCSAPPAIDGFIQKRLNKTSHLGEDSLQNRPPRPQSLVIEKR